MRRYKLPKCKRVRGVHLVPGGLLVAGAADARLVGSLDWLDPATGESVRRFAGAAPAYAVAADGSRAVLLAADDTDGPDPVRVTDPRPGGAPEWRGLPDTLYPNDGVGGAAIDATGQRLAFGVERDRPGGTSRLVPVVGFGGELLAVLCVDCEPDVLAFSPAGGRLAVAGGRRGPLRVFDLATKMIVHMSTLGGPPRAVAFAPDGTRLAVAFDQFVGFLVAGVPTDAAFRRHPKQVNGVAFTPDGSRLLTACHDGVVRVWDVASARELAAFDWGIGAATAVAVAADGLTAAVGGEKGQVVVWDVDA